LSLEDNEIDFMLQEMVAFKDEESKGESEASVKTKKPVVPNVPGSGGEVTISDIAAALRERNKK
jgi:hypothetical protein